MPRVLITGGAGFIGSWLAEELIDHGFSVRVLDILDQQVHPSGKVPDYLTPLADFYHGDVCDRHAVANALHGVDMVFHLAAAVGVGQSMYDIRRYCRTNDMGTATLLEAIAENGGIGRLVVASSMSIYGEGTAMGRQPFPTAESRPADPRSLYALQKYSQERACLLFGEAVGVPTTALRFFNVYGPRQSLSNPYTGVLAIFASQLLSYRRPTVFEDGRQVRDFVEVRDVARACRKALDLRAAGQVLNVGTGRPVQIVKMAELVCDAFGSHLRPIVTGERRAGDVRACYADTRKATRIVGWRAKIPVEAGVPKWAAWCREQDWDDRSEQARRELMDRGLLG